MKNYYGSTQSESLFCGFSEDLPENQRESKSIKNTDHPDSEKELRIMITPRLTTCSEYKACSSFGDLLK